MLISPYDKSSTNDVIKAVRDSDLGVNPTDEGNHIRVTLPELTEERRRDYVKLAGQKPRKVAYLFAVFAVKPWISWAS